VSGAVRDASSGEPVEAWIARPGSDRGVIADPIAGAFHLYAADGALPDAIVASAPGYLSAEIPLDPAGQFVDIALEPESIAQGAARPSVLGGPGLVALPEGLRDARSGSVTLSRPDADPVVVSTVAGAFALDPAALAPGWWTLETSGAVLPRALLIEAREGTALVGWTVDGDRARIDLDPLDPGAMAMPRAFAVWGRERALHPLPVLSTESDHLMLDISGVPREDNVDMMLVLDGSVVGVDDLFDPRLADGASGLSGGGCGCSGTTAPHGCPTDRGPTWAVALAGGLIAARRWRR
jgi:hypothetical protein